MSTAKKHEDIKEAAARLVGGDSMADAVAGLAATPSEAMGHAVRMITFLGGDARMQLAAEFAASHGFPDISALPA